MANVLYTTSLVAREALAMFQVNAPFLVTGSRTYESEFMQGPYKKGDTLNIRRVNQFVAGDGSTVVPQGIIQDVEQLTLDHQYNTAISLTTKESTLEIEDFRQEFLRPAIQALIAKMEVDIGTSAATNLNYFVPGVVTGYINSFATVDLAGANLLNLGVALNDESYLAMSVRDGTALKSGLVGNFTPVYNEDIVRNSAIGHISYFDAFQSQNIYTQVAGVGPVTYSSDTLTVTNTVTSGSTIVLGGATASQTNYFNAGDIISIAGVNSVNPISYSDTGQNMQFVITAAANSSGAGAVTITVSPAIDTSDARRNVTGPVLATSAVTTVPSHRVNVAYTRRSLDIICPPLDRLEVAKCSVETDPRTGISLRVATQGDIFSDTNIMRIDVLAGFKWHPQYAVRVPSKPTN